MSNTITLSYTNDFKPINNHIPLLNRCEYTVSVFDLIKKS